MKTIKFEREPQQTETIIKKGKITPTDRPDNKRIKESNDFSIKHDTIEKRVKSLLRYDKYARKDDLFLLLLYYVKCNMIKIIVPLEDFKKIHKPESITRAKRYLFEKAKKGDNELKWLLDDQETLKTREREERKYREYFGNRR